MEYWQKVIIKFLTYESVDAHENHMRLSAELGEQTYASSVIQFWGRQIQRPREDFHDEHRSGRPGPGCIETKIIS
jgi:hypothetical protein